MWLFIYRQSCTCPRCGEIFEDEVDALIEKRWQYILDRKAETDAPDYWSKELARYWREMKTVCLHSVGNNTGSKWQVDHRVPIFKGGDGIGLDNVHVICTTCHQKKTAGENSNRLKDLFKGD
jgi:5-methylcytosine-specific restriction endonuclease McrA